MTHACAAPLCGHGPEEHSWGRPGWCAWGRTHGSPCPGPALVGWPALLAPFTDGSSLPLQLGRLARGRLLGSACSGGRRCLAPSHPWPAALPHDGLQTTWIFPHFLPQTATVHPTVPSGDTDKLSPRCQEPPAAHSGAPLPPDAHSSNRAASLRPGVEATADLVHGPRLRVLWEHVFAQGPGTSRWLRTL